MAIFRRYVKLPEDREKVICFFCGISSGFDGARIKKKKHISDINDAWLMITGDYIHQFI